MLKEKASAYFLYDRSYQPVLAVYFQLSELHRSFILSLPDLMSSKARIFF